MFVDTALILEGGGMRGAYSAGVLDVFHDHGLRFGGYAGTSAGATHLCNYVSEQKGRNFRIDTVHSKDPRYMGWKNLLKTGNFFDVDFCYGTLPYSIDPFDFETFKRNAAAAEVFACMTDVEKGAAEYKQLHDIDLREEIDFVRASASLPLFSNIVEVAGGKYLDGGICDSIPFQFMRRRGFKRQVVILTRPLGYRKGRNRALPLFKLAYRKYPAFLAAIASRHIHYNACLAELERLEEEGSAFVFRPSEQRNISRLERDTGKLAALYDLGVKDATDQMDRLKAFLL